MKIQCPEVHLVDYKFVVSTSVSFCINIYTILEAFKDLHRCLNLEELESLATGLSSMAVAFTVT